MGAELFWLHGVYVLFVLIIIAAMVMKRDTSLLCMIGIAVLGLTATGSVTTAVGGLFGSFIYAITELLPTILVISIIVAMSQVLSETGINETMIKPVSSLIRTPALAFWVIGLVMMAISWFFWPSPAVALVGAVLLPAAIRVGLPAIGVAVAMNLFGHGIALSGDFIIQGRPLDSQSSLPRCRRHFGECSSRNRHGSGYDSRGILVLEERYEERTCRRTIEKD